MYLFIYLIYIYLLINIYIYLFTFLLRNNAAYRCVSNKYSRTPLIRNNWCSDASRHAENPDNWIFLWKNRLY